MMEEVTRGGPALAWSAALWRTGSNPVPMASSLAVCRAQGWLNGGRRTKKGRTDGSPPFPALPSSNWRKFSLSLRSISYSSSTLPGGRWDTGRKSKSSAAIPHPTPPHHTHQCAARSSPPPSLPKRDRQTNLLEDATWARGSTRREKKQQHCSPREGAEGTHRAVVGRAAKGARIPKERRQRKRRQRGRWSAGGMSPPTAFLARGRASAGKGGPQNAPGASRRTRVAG